MSITRISELFNSAVGKEEAPRIPRGLDEGTIVTGLLLPAPLVAYLVRVPDCVTTGVPLVLDLVLLAVVLRWLRLTN